MTPPSVQVSTSSDVKESLRSFTEQLPKFMKSHHYAATIALEPVRERYIVDNTGPQKRRTTGTVRDHGKNDIRSEAKEGKEEEYEFIHQKATVWKENLLNTCPLCTEHRARLLGYLDSRSNDAAASLLLITGRSGAGKTRLANCLRDPVEARGGYFLTGKFNQRQLLEPYMAFVSAFTEFTNAVVRKGDKMVEKTRDAIIRAIGDDKDVLTGMIPALERLLGMQVDLDGRSRSGDSTHRFVFVFRKFLSAVSTPKRPIVLLLDDVHWADPCSLDLLANIVEMTNKGLMIIMTCDTNVSADSYLSQKLREIEDVSRVSITNVSLPNINLTEVHQAVAHILGRSLDECRALAMIVKCQTDVRPFFMAEYFRWLEDSGLLYLDRTTGLWSWNEDDIRVAIKPGQPGQFLFDRLDRLPCTMKDVLKIASCLGIRIEKTLIEYALGHSIDGTLSAIQEVLHYDEFQGVLTFGHDELQQASYQLILEVDRERFHLEIGRKIWRALDRDGVDRYIFVILSQLAVARRIITRENERIGTAHLCLAAGKKAAKASAFRIAAFYLSLGIELVGDRGWRDEYHLTLALHNAGAEMEMILTNYERVEALVNEVISRARNDMDKIQAHVTQMSMLANRGRHEESLDLGIGLLQKLDEYFPTLMCNARLLSEIRSVKRLLKGKSDEQILRMPLIADERKLACFKILNHMYFSALWVRPILHWFIALKSVKLTMNYGLSNFSASAFPIYGIMCISAFDDIDEGYRFGELGLKLLDNCGSMEHLARVYAVHYGVIHSWKKPIQEAIGPLWKAAQVGAQTGDIEFSSFCANCYMKLSSNASRNLCDWLQSFDDIKRTVVARRQEMLVRMISLHVQAAHEFVGLTNGQFSPEDEQLSSKQVFVHASRMRTAYIFNDFELASQMVTGVSLLGAPTVCLTDVVFFSCLVAVAAARFGRHRRRNIAIAEQRLKLLRKWSQAAPFNYAHKKYLVEAELASVRKRNGEAMEYYTCAIALATRYDFTLEVALANERAAQHLVRIGEKEAAEPFYQQACLSYAKWGGKAKLVRLKEEIDSIYSSATSPLPPFPF